jgi:hypothetical protein
MNHCGKVASLEHTPAKIAISGTDIVREMGCTQREFEHWLPGATRNAVIDRRQQGAAVEHYITASGGTLIIATTELPPRRIALMRMPVLQVRFHFIDMAQAMRADFLHYFDLYTRRGGG